MAKDGRRKAQTRRRESTRRKKKFNPARYTLYYIVGLLLLVSTGVILSFTVFFNIEVIELSGNTRYPEGEVLLHSGINIGDNLLELDEEAMVTTLKAQYPYFETVELIRGFPSTATIVVTEAVVDGALPTESGFALLTDYGRVLEYTATPPEDWIDLCGYSMSDVEVSATLSEADMEMYLLLKSVREQIELNALENVNVIDFSDLLNIKFLLDKRLIINLGSDSDLEYKFTFVKQVLEESLAEGVRGILDASDRPTVSLREVDIWSDEYWSLPQDVKAKYMP